MKLPSSSRHGGRRQRGASRSRELKVTQELDDAATGREEPREDGAGWEVVR